MNAADIAQALGDAGKDASAALRAQIGDNP